MFLVVSESVFTAFSLIFIYALILEHHSVKIGQFTVRTVIRWQQ